MKTPHPLQEIISELTGESGSRSISRERVLEWMRAELKEWLAKSTAHTEAMEWVDGGGRSPFWM